MMGVHDVMYDAVYWLRPHCLEVTRELNEVMKIHDTCTTMYCVCVCVYASTSASIDRQTCPCEEHNFGKSSATPLMFY